MDGITFQFGKVDLFGEEGQLTQGFPEHVGISYVDNQFVAVIQVSNDSKFNSNIMKITLADGSWCKVRYTRGEKDDYNDINDKYYCIIEEITTGN